MLWSRGSVVSKKLTTSEFIRKAVVVHGDQYNYDKTEYVVSCAKVVIVCKIHGDFKQKPNSHLMGSGCRSCSYSINGDNRTKTL
jgi:hypothetical protein